jgi:acyl-CoA synthetase (NDP forming)
MTATPTLDARAISRLLRPRSVAIVGASASPGALGASVLANLDRLKFDGDIFLINPKRAEIGARACLPSVEDLPEDVDVAVLAIPGAAVLDTVKALARRRVGAAIIYAAGFAEGGEEGLKIQREIARIASDSGMVIEGPNCLGIVNYVDGISLTFVQTSPTGLGSRPGVGIVSQSGAMAAVLSVMLISRSLGISYSISTGNEAASGVEDYLDYLLDDAHTQVIGMIVEQFREPRRLLGIAARARALGKPIVLLHPGRSGAARASAATHTGAMAGDYALMRAKVAREGVIFAESLEELGDILELSLRCAARTRGGTVMITESGAFKALTLDLCEQEGLPLPEITDQNAPRLRAAIPEFVPVSNPLDLTAQALIDPDLYRRTLAALIDDERFGSIVFGIIQTDAATCTVKFPPIIAAIKDLGKRKPIVFTGLDEGAAVPPDFIAQLRALGVAYFPSPDRALRALARWHAAPQPHRTATPGAPAAAGLTAHTAAVAPPSPDAMPLAATLPPGVIPEYRAKRLLAPIGIPFPAGRLASDVAQAIRAADELGYPVALKAQSAEISHKSDVGGVILSLADPAAVAAGWQRLTANIARHRADLTLDGVLVEKMGARGVELIVGARNDPEWGAVVVAGFGGIQAEILNDVRLMTPDMAVDEIAGELDRLKSAALLRGFRGEPPLDVRAVAELIARLGAWLLETPEVREIDLNPLIVYPVGQGVMALDALIYVG